MFEDKVVDFGEIVLKNKLDKPGIDGIAEKLDQMMPSIYIMIATLGALIVLIIILTKFLYNPVKKMVEERQKYIQKNIDDSLNAKLSAINKEQEARDKLQESNGLAQEIINNSKIEAETIKNEYINKAKNEAKKITDDAKVDIQNIKEKLEKETKAEIITIATEISEKIIKEKISPKTAEKYLEEYLGE